MHWPLGLNLFKKRQHGTRTKCLILMAAHWCPIHVKNYSQWVTGHFLRGVSAHPSLRNGSICYPTFILTSARGVLQVQILTFVHAKVMEVSKGRTGVCTCKTWMHVCHVQVCMCRNVGWKVTPMYHFSHRNNTKMDFCATRNAN